jgi:hypothetical protein
VSDYTPTENAKQTLIYVLRDPSTKAIRYVGKTTDTLKKRLKGHLSDARRGREDMVLYRWLRLLMEQDLKPIIALVETVPPHMDWADREQHWIAYMRRNGFDLLNTSDGGESGNGLPSHKNPNVKLTPEQVNEIRTRYFASGISQRSLGKQYGVSECTIWNIIHGKTWAEYEGPIEPERFVRLPDSTVLTIRNRAATGESYQSIADDFGLSPSHVNQIAIGRLYPNVDGPITRKGSAGKNNGRAKLTIPIVLEIRDLYATGSFSYSDLAVQFGVTASLIAQIVCGEIWRDIGGSIAKRKSACKINPKVAQEIRALYAMGDYSQEMLGVKFGVAQTTISQIIRGVRWREDRSE